MKQMEIKKENRGEEKVEKKEKKTSKQGNITSSPLLIRKFHFAEYECLGLQA
jgi:hypothetical protein